MLVVFIVGIFDELHVRSAAFGEVTLKLERVVVSRRRCGGRGAVSISVGFGIVVGSFPFYMLEPTLVSPFAFTVALEVPADHIFGTDLALGDEFSDFFRVDILAFITKFAVTFGAKINAHLALEVSI